MKKHVSFPVAVPVGSDSGLRSGKKSATHKRRGFSCGKDLRRSVCGRRGADGWPEGPVTILFHHEKSKAPWAHNPAIRVPGLEAASPASARTLVCVEESQVEMGHYDSGEPGYAPSWGTILVRLSDRKVYFMGRSLDGEMPPQVKYKSGAGVGKPPTEILVRWLRLVLEQKVARFKMRLKWKEYAEVSAMAFSVIAAGWRWRRLRVVPSAAEHLLHRLRFLTLRPAARGHHARGLFDWGNCDLEVGKHGCDRTLWSR